MPDQTVVPWQDAGVEEGSERVSGLARHRNRGEVFCILCIPHHGFDPAEAALASFKVGIPETEVLMM